MRSPFGQHTSTDYLIQQQNLEIPYLHQPLEKYRRNTTTGSSCTPLHLTSHFGLIHTRGWSVMGLTMQIKATHDNQRPLYIFLLFLMKVISQCFAYHFKFFFYKFTCHTDPMILAHQKSQPENQLHNYISILLISLLLCFWFFL
jgi:hypothetical protein